MATRIKVDGADVIFDRLDALPKDAQKALRKASKGAAEELVPQLQGAADTPQARLVAPGIRAVSDRLPAIVAGGSAVVRRGKAKQGLRGKSKKKGGGGEKTQKVTASMIFFGSEFGGGKRNTTQQFRPHNGRDGYWFFPTIKKNTEQLKGAWMDALDDVEREWSRG